MTAFGEDGAAWGDVEAPVDDLESHDEGGDSLGGEIDLGGGFKLVMSPDAFRQIMHTPEITAKVQQRCEELADTANGMAVAEGAEYTFFVSNNPENIRARGRVKTGNGQAIHDNLTNSTLLKALASVGSDPKPYGGDNTPEGASSEPAAEVPEPVEAETPEEL